MKIMPDDTPTKINGLIPHQPPMLVVDQLIHLSEDEAVTTTIFAADSIFLNPDGLVDETIFFEMMAQTFAVFMVVGKKSQGLDVGYLVGVKRLAIGGRAQVGLPVETRIKITSVVDAFSVFEGRVSQGGQLLASGQVTVFIPPGVSE